MRKEMKTEKEFPHDETAAKGKRHNEGLHLKASYRGVTESAGGSAQGLILDRVELVEEAVSCLAIHVTAIVQLRTSEGDVKQEEGRPVGTPLPEG
jgi:hypothetical protein